MKGTTMSLNQYMFHLVVQNPRFQPAYVAKNRNHYIQRRWRWR